MGGAVTWRELQDTPREVVQLWEGFMAGENAAMKILHDRANQNQ